MRLERSSHHCAESDPLEFRATHRKVMLQLMRLRCSAYGEALGGGRFLVQYDQFVDSVSATFDAKERLLRRHAHPALSDVRSAHLGIISTLAATRDSLRARASMAPAEFIHRFDSLVVYLTVERARYTQPEPV
jgi:hypothetical protein